MTVIFYKQPVTKPTQLILCEVRGSAEAYSDLTIMPVVYGQGTFQFLVLSADNRIYIKLLNVG